MPRVLVLQLKRIGDAILTAPAMAALRQALPDAHITLALDTAAWSLAPAFGMADDHLRYAHGPAARDCWRVAMMRKFDAVLDFSGTDRSAGMTLLSRAKVRAGYAKDLKNWLRKKAYTHTSHASVRELHTIDLHRALVATALEALGLQPPPEVSDHGHLTLPPDLAAPALPSPCVVVHPGTARPEKYWPADRWQAVIHHIQQQHQLPVVLTGSAAPEEIQHLAEIESGTSVQANFAGQLTLLQLASVISSAALVLGVDSAAMHLAGAFRRPQIALYGPTNPFHWRPRHDRAIILTAGNPPDLPLQPRHPQHPMTDLPFAQVNAAVDCLLAGGEIATTLRQHL